MNVEAENAVMREKARIREEVVKINQTATSNVTGEIYIPRAQVLAIINNEHESATTH